jgi:CRP-like cAMP-binding protein
MGQLGPDLCERLLHDSGSRQYEPGAILLAQGQMSTHVVIIRSGLVKVAAVAEDGRESLLSIRGRGDIVGELAAMDGLPRSATVSAWGKVGTREITQAHFRAFLEGNAAASSAVAHTVADRLRVATRRRVELGGHSARIRVVHVLVELGFAYGKDIPGGHRLIDLQLTHADLAAAAGVAVRTAQRVIDELAREGIVSKRYRGVTIERPDRLAVMASDREIPA